MTVLKCHNKVGKETHNTFSRFESALNVCGVCEGGKTPIVCLSKAIAKRKMSDEPKVLCSFMRVMCPVIGSRARVACC